ncbi:hypothetical protein R3P38DRAFT_3362880 [Favolaschia claudopus]|uniref:Uncharacterized protein n=1 Tax=Favolaschia claudopus TaxID=2862362 RepID=A0AAW0ALY4_9AGAR
MSEVAKFIWGEIAEFPPFKVAKSRTSSEMPTKSMSSASILKSNCSNRFPEIVFEEKESPRAGRYGHVIVFQYWFDAEAQSDDLPPLNPAMPTSSFSYDPNTNSGHAPYTGTGPSSSKQATRSVPSGSRNPRFNCSTGPSSRRPSASRPLHTAPAENEDVFQTYPAPRPRRGFTFRRRKLIFGTNSSDVVLSPRGNISLIVALLIIEIHARYLHLALSLLYIHYSILLHIHPADRHRPLVISIFSL